MALEPMQPPANPSVSWKTRVLEVAALLAVLFFIAALLIPSVGSVRQKSSRAAYENERRQEATRREMAFVAERPEVEEEMLESTTATGWIEPQFQGTEADQTPSFGERSRRAVSADFESNRGDGAEVASAPTPPPAAAVMGPRARQIPSDRFSDVASLDRTMEVDSDGAFVGASRADAQPSAGSASAADPFAVHRDAVISNTADTPTDFFARSGVAHNSSQSAPSASSFPEAERMTRKQMLTQVNQHWERPKVFEIGNALTERTKSTSIVIPQVNFSGVPLSEVVKTLNSLIREYDTEAKGVVIDYTPAPGQDPRVNVSLRNLSVDRILQFITQQINYEVTEVNNTLRIQPAGTSAVEQHAAERAHLVRQTPKEEKATAEEPISTFSLNVSDVSFRLAQAALANARVPEAASIRTEEFVNSFDYRDPAPRPDEPVALSWEIAQHPYAHNRQIVRFSLQTRAAGRSASQPLNLSLLLDNSGSMQRPDRQAILQKSLRSLDAKLTEQDQLNIVLFSRQPRLIAEAKGRASQQSALHNALNYRPEGGTNLEAGLEAAYATARRHYNPAAVNRVILMTDGAANLGNVQAKELADMVVAQRKQGIALDAYGIGWDDYNDALLEEITRNGDGRYAFLNSPDAAPEDFSEKLAGTLQVAAEDVKVQIIWNPERVVRYRQIGYDLHRLKTEDFRDNTVDAAEIAEAESGTALYVLQINDDPDLLGNLGRLHVRYREPATGQYVERSWPLNLPNRISPMESASPALRLATASAFLAERLANNPYSSGYGFGDLHALTTGLPAAFPTQTRVVDLQNMIQSARNLFSEDE